MVKFLRYCVCFAVLLYVHFASGVAAPSSQQVGRGGNLDGCRPGALHVAFWGFNPLILLNEELVRKELDVSPDQAQKLDQLVNAYLQSLRQIVLQERQPKAMPREQNAASSPRRADRQRQATHDFGTRAVASLTPSQRRRLEQVAFQLRGVEVFFMPRIGASLRLNEAQCREIASVRSWLISEARRIRASTPSGKTISTPMPRQRQEAERRIIGILTKEQMQQIELLRGKPICFSCDDLSMVLRRRKR